MKTNFLNKLKQGLFLLIAVLGTFVGFSQSTQNPTIGGKNTPGDLGGLLDIGGGKSSNGGLGLVAPFANLTTQCTLVFLNETGGRGGKGTDSGTGQVDFPDDFDDLDTGGRSTGGELTDLNTGGKNSKGGMEIYCPLCPDTGGGNGGKSTTGEYANFDIGGRDSGGGLNPLNDIGGRGETDTGPGLIIDIVGSSPSGIGFYENEQSYFSKIERYGCVLRPLFITD